ncbi:TRAF-interacting protein with FHA domain-containing protein A isoform X2 [Canis lupus dingo]|uniref:TRAF-interacting protein with FHA domain-containing protein A n=1 Tax=Canis lupus dingo TaxID=286419 RepID=A0A8C0L085_CANLU|nr:TRAF-interacting protein with FHA domain-containing protein A isoform X2 [Canis lupus dingo]
MMSNFEDADTEETVTCLQITVYHPGQLQNGIFQSIRFYNREKLPSSEVVKFGRNSNICRYTFQDKQVSRVQFSLQLFKKFDSSVLSFEIKNMSKKTNLLVDNKELCYLNKIDLPYKCMVRFDHSYKKTTGQYRSPFLSMAVTHPASPKTLLLQKWMKMNCEHS